MVVRIIGPPDQTASLGLLYTNEGGVPDAEEKNGPGSDDGIHANDTKVAAGKADKDAAAVRERERGRGKMWERNE